MECVSMDNDNPLTQLRFEAAVKVIRSLPPDGSFQPSNDMMLKFYSYFKQATLGPCNIPRPGFWDAVGKAKWDAWSSLGDMSKEDAMAAYVEEMKLILEGMPITGEVEELLRVMGPFYELVEEKKRITQISDLSAARLTKFARQLDGLGSMLSSMPSKSVTKSIIRTMEMNGSLEDWPARGRPQISAGETKEEEDEEDDDDEDEEEEEEEEEYDLTREVGKDKQSTASLPNRKASTRRTKVPLSNGKANGVPHLTNGSQPKATVNGSISAPESRINGHPAEPSKDVSGVVHLASDSDSEVYCDSVDQFGQEEGSELNRSLDDLDEDENQSPTALEEETHSHGTLEDLPGPLGGTQRGGEEVESGAGSSRRKSLNGDTSDRSPVRGGRGSRTAGGVGSGVLGNWQGGGGDGDRERWGGGATTPSGSLNEQIVVALARLQEDMQSVLDRLHTLEALGATQARSLALSPTFVPPPVNKTSKKPRWWPFDISFSAVAFAVIWPFVVQWLIRLYLQRRKRRIN